MSSLYQLQLKEGDLSYHKLEPLQKGSILFLLLCHFYLYLIT